MKIIGHPEKDDTRVTDNGDCEYFDGEKWVLYEFKVPLMNIRRQ